MSVRAPLPAGTVETARRLMREHRNKSDYRRFQIVYLAAFRDDLTYAEIGAITGYCSAYVGHVLTTFRRAGFPGLVAKKQGGRHGANLTQAEEAAILAPFLEEAKQGGILVVHGVHKALNAYTGHRWASSSVYELLTRHGWRKIVPRRSHPKTSADRQAAFKKNFNAGHRTSAAR